MANAKAIKRPAKTAGFTPVVKKTAAYTVKTSDSGTLFKWNSDTAFNFTLPPVTKSQAGVFFDFSIEVLPSSGAHGVAPASTDKIFILSKTDGQAVTFDDTVDAVGDGFRLISDGVDGWHLVFARGTFA